MSMGIIAGVIGAGAAVYGASQSGGDAPAPIPNDPGKSLLKYLKGLNQGLPQLAGMEGEYRPLFGALNLADQQQYLSGIIGMGGASNAAAAEQLQAARQQDFANMRSNAGGVMGVLGGIDPAGREQAARASAMADTAYQRAIGPMGFQDARLSDQNARESFAARGRINDNASVAGEILGREEVRADQRAEATALGNNAFELNQRYSSPALGMLMGTPASTALGQDYLGASRGIIGQNNPQFINPDAGINMGMQQTANLNAYNMANASMQAQQGAAWGNVGGSLMGLAGTIYQANAK
jgi:hypothetical protein